MKITKKDMFYAIIIVLILLLGNLYFMNKVNNMSQKFNNYENTIKALSDTISISVKNGITEYSKKTPEIYLDEFIKSAVFKSMSTNQQKYYNELSKIKGLISATNVELEKQGIALATLKSANPGKVIGDSITYKLGSELTFVQVDTTKVLKWSGLLIIDKNPTFKLDYNYKVNIMTTFERNKDKSIVVRYKINDPELKITDMMNYIIPAEQKRTKIGRWIEKNKQPIYATIGGVIFVAGGYTGFNLAK